MSYMMIGAHALASWKGLYDGSVPWTAPANVAQLTAWQKLHTMGCTNPDVLTKTNNIQDFEKNKAAMLVDGTWETAQYTSTMGNKVAAFVPPFSNTPVHGVVEFAGDGFSMTTYSAYPKQDAMFLDFLTTAAAGKGDGAAVRADLGRSPRRPAVHPEHLRAADHRRPRRSGGQADDEHPGPDGRLA